MPFRWTKSVTGTSSNKRDGNWRNNQNSEITARFMTSSVEEEVKRYNSAAHLSNASTRPSSWYKDPRLLELESGAVFSRARPVCTPQSARRAGRRCQGQRQRPARIL